MAAGATRKSRDTSSAPYVLEDQIGHLLRRAHQRHTAIFAAGMAAANLTPTQYAALVKIRDLGQVTQNRLGRLTAMDPATVQGVVNRLNARTLVERRADPANKRRKILTLTESGKELVQNAIPVGQQISNETLAPLNDAERTRLLDLLAKLI